MDLSFPEGGSINDGINKDRYRGKEVNLRLPGVDALLQIIFKKGRACLLFCRDLKSAYKQVPVCIGEIDLLGYTHKGLVYFDLTLPMGLTNSAFICQQVTDMIMYIFKQEGYDGTNYLDDLAVAELLELAQQAYQILADILVACGAQEAEAKAIPPSMCMLFLGILIDTILMRLSIDDTRMREIRTELKNWLNRSHANLKQMQSLVGKLNFCATAVRAGRLFFSRILAFMKQMPQAGHVRIPEEVTKDIDWWLKFMPQFNGISAIPENKWTGPNADFLNGRMPTGHGRLVTGGIFSHIVSYCNNKQSTCLH